MARRPVEDEAARTFLRVAYALDRRSRQKDRTRLVPWDLDPVRLPGFATWTDLDEALRLLARRTRALPPGFRREWLAGHIPTLQALAALVKGRVPPLPDQVRLFYDLPAREAREEELEALRSQIRRYLPVTRADGLRGSVEAWERGQRVTRERVLPTMSGFLQEARKGARRMFELPRRELVTLVGVRQARTSGVCVKTRSARL